MINGICRNPDAGLWNLCYQPFKKGGREGVEMWFGPSKAIYIRTILMRVWILRKQRETGSVYRNITALVAFRLQALSYSLNKVGWDVVFKLQVWVKSRSFYLLLVTIFYHTGTHTWLLRRLQNRDTKKTERVLMQA